MIKFMARKFSASAAKIQALKTQNFIIAQSKFLEPVSPTDGEPFAIKITEEAKSRIQHLKKLKDIDDLALRIFIDSGGCSGFQYNFEIIDMANVDEKQDFLF